MPYIWGLMQKWKGFLGGGMVKYPTANAGDARDAGSIPGLGRSPGGGHGNPLQYSCLENPMDRGASWARVHRVARSWTRLKHLSPHAWKWKRGIWMLKSLSWDLMLLLTNYMKYGQITHLSEINFPLAKEGW